MPLKNRLLRGLQGKPNHSLALVRYLPSFPLNVNQRFPGRGEESTSLNVRIHMANRLVAQVAGLADAAMQAKPGAEPDGKDHKGYR